MLNFFTGKLYTAMKLISFGFISQIISKKPKTQQIKKAVIFIRLLRGGGLRNKEAIRNKK